MPRRRANKEITSPVHRPPGRITRGHARGLRNHGDTRATASHRPARLWQAVSRQTKGRLAEAAALMFLIFKGYRPLVLRLRGRSAEVDVLVQRGGVVCLVEVKARASREEAHRAIRPDQRTRLNRQAARIAAAYPASAIRLDAVLIYPHAPFLEHCQNAWEGEG